MFSRESWCLVESQWGKCPSPLQTPMVRSDDDIFLKNFGKMHKFWSLGLELQVSSLGLGVFDEVSVSSRNFNQVSVSKVAVSTTSLRDFVRDKADHHHLRSTFLKKALFSCIFASKPEFLTKFSVRTLSRFSIFLGWSQYHGLGKRFSKVSYEC